MSTRTYRSSQRRPSSRAPALRRLGDRVLEAATAEELARLLTRDLPAALGVPSASVLLWNRQADVFERLDETGALAATQADSQAEAPQAGFLVSDGHVLETAAGGRTGALVPLLGRAGLVGMLQLDVAAGRRRVPFRPAEARLITTIATRAALGLENHLYARELVATERVATLGAMAGMLAHDFRTPMTVVRGHAELLLQHEDETVRKRGALIVSMIDRLDAMTRDILDFARSKSGVPRRAMTAAALVEDLVLTVQSSLPGLEVRVEGQPPADATVLVDIDRLRRAVANIAQNAREAMGGAGVLHLSARAEDRPSPRLVLLLADEGPGIPAEIRATLFEPFVTRGKKGGTGLGLAVTKRFVEEHGGTVQLLADAPRGAAFRIALPLAATATP
ncbi:MAG TPA: HAMP domain-containing sensor histidine kinase [Vicinamibacteria bacterium]|nr:HAMP domain-containing sensor histidine kinase [Vicinamibacteria bacterium]